MFEWLRTLDAEVLLAINSAHHPWADELMWFFSLSWPTYLLVILFAFTFYRKYTLKKALEFLLGCAMIVACCDVASNIAKHNIKRFRPTHNTEISPRIHVVRNYYGGKFGFFSAHAANTWGVVTYLFLTLKYIDRRWRMLLFLYPIIVMYSRMYLGVHYPSDVITGMVCGIFFGSIGYLLIKTYFLKSDEAAA